MTTRIALALALLAASITASSAATAKRHVVPAWNAHAQVQTQPTTRTDLQSLYDLSARIHRDTFTHD